MPLPPHWADSWMHLPVPEAQWGPGGRAAHKLMSQCPGGQLHKAHGGAQAAAGATLGGLDVLPPSV